VSITKIAAGSRLISLMPPRFFSSFSRSRSSEAISFLGRRS